MSILKTKHINISSFEFLLLIYVIVLSLILRFIIYFFPLKLYKSLLFIRTYGSVEKYSSNKAILKKTLRRFDNLNLITTTCLVRAITFKILGVQLKVNSCIHFIVYYKKTKLNAHAQIMFTNNIKPLLLTNCKYG